MNTTQEKIQHYFDEAQAKHAKKYYYRSFNLAVKYLHCDVL
jgi:hypothetical protein